MQLDQVRLTREGHAAALSWIKSIYLNPERLEKAASRASYFELARAVITLYCHATPYLLALNIAGRFLLFGVLDFNNSELLRNGLLFTFLGLNPDGDSLIHFHIPVLACSILFGLSVATIVAFASNIKRRFHRLAVGSVAGPLLGVGYGFFLSVFAGYFIGLLGGLFFGIVRPPVFGISVGLAFSLLIGFLLGVTGGLPPYIETVITIGILGGLVFGFASGIGAKLNRDRSVGIAFGLGSLLVFSLGTTVLLEIAIETISFSHLLLGFRYWAAAYLVAFFRLYYMPYHLLMLWPSSTLTEFYPTHPASWDRACLFPFPALDKIILSYSEYDTEGAEREVEKLLFDASPQRTAALRARAVLVARRSAETEDISCLDDVLAALPQGTTGFLQETAEIRRLVHDITAAQVLLETIDRSFLRLPFASLVVKNIETFEKQIAGYRPPLSAELGVAARRWLRVAMLQLESAQSDVANEPVYQVFRAGDPVDRDREAFVVRGAILGELERQVMLAAGCPGLVIYGRRRMGKSTFVRNLPGLLPPELRLASISMQKAHAFTSLQDLLALLGQRMSSSTAFSTAKLPGNLKEFEDFLDLIQCILEDSGRRLLVSVDEYEFMDRKIGEGVLSEDLLAVLRESTQTHRRIIWAFVGSHAICELTNAPWASYLVSSRTLQVQPFEAEETRLLLTEPLKHSTLWSDSEDRRPRFEPGFWGDGGIEYLHTSTGGWPHLVQLVAENAIDLVNDTGASRMDSKLLEDALDRSVERGNNVFQVLLEKESQLPGEWDYLKGFRTADEQVAPPDEAIARSLQRRQLVNIGAADEPWCLAVPLMGRWLRSQL